MDGHGAGEMPIGTVDAISPSPTRHNHDPRLWDALISSDEESDLNDVDDAEDYEADMADYLPSIPEIIATLEGAERGRADTAGK